MTLVAPWTALFAALVTVPLLLLLYFLKLRRRTLRLPSTLLWERSFDDLQVNVPFQRLRSSLLLLLQLLILAALLLALAQPRAEAGVALAPRLVLLVDRSASMNAIDGPGDPSRLDRAKAQASDLVRELGRGRGADVMVVAFAASARLVSTYESDRDLLLERIDTIEPSDGRADLAEALRLAEAFANRSSVESDPAAPVDVLLLSDGGVEPPGSGIGFDLRAGDFRFLRIGPPPGAPVANVGIVTLGARRDFDDPARVLLFARLLNAGPEDVEAVLTLERDGEVAGVQSLTIPRADGDNAGEASATFALEIAERAVFTLRHNVADDLGDDDRAHLLLPAPNRPVVALVHGEAGPNAFLEDLLASMDLQRVESMTLATFETLDPELIDRGGRFDLIVFDGVPPPRLPGVPSITFGGVPAGMAVTGPAPDSGRRLLTWQRQHPLLRHVTLDDVVYSGFSGYDLPAGATAIAYGPDGPIMATLSVRGARHVLVGFELNRSNWPVQVSFTVFCVNAVDHLTLAGSGLGQVYRPGEPITVRAAPDATRLVVEGPVSMEVDAVPGALKTLPPVERAGLYTVQGAAPPDDVLAVSMLSDVESDIRPAEELVVNARTVEAGAAGDAVPRELWPYLVALAAVLLVVEWLTYCFKMKS